MMIEMSIRPNTSVVERVTKGSKVKGNHSVIVSWVMRLYNSPSLANRELSLVWQYADSPLRLQAIRIYDEGQNYP